MLEESSCINLCTYYILMLIVGMLLSLPQHLVIVGATSFHQGPGVWL